MIKKYIKIFLLLICTISFFKSLIYICNDSNSYREEYKEIYAKIINIENDEDKTVIDVKAKEKYKITIYEKNNYNLGDKVFIKGIFKTPSNNTIFNLFNYRKYLLSKNIKMTCNECTLILIKENQNIFYILKNNILKRISNFKTYNYLNAFLLGNTNDIEDDVKNSYQDLGIIHLFSVSGMHVGLFTLVLNKLLKKLKYKDYIIFLFLLLFSFLTNFTVSILRCFLFMLLNYFNKLLKLELSNIKVLIITLFLLLLFNSYLVFNVGFIFSFVTTYFIMLSNKILENKTYITKLFLISIISFMANIPILANYYFKINLLTPLFNIIFVPFVSFIIFPISIITFIFPLFDNLLFYIMNLFELIAINLDKIKFLNVVIAKPNILLIFLYYLFLYLMIKKDKKYLIGFIVILIININIRYTYFDKKIVFLDVGQGDSALIIYPKGKTIVIDTGGIYNSNYSIVENKTIQYLNSLGITKLQTLIITHGDYDHMGEAINLVDNFKVEKVIFNCGPYNELEKELIRVLDKKKIKYYSCIKELNIDNNKLYFLNNKDYGNENDNSSVIYTELNKYKFLFMGDAGVEVEEDLIQKYNLKDIDVLKVGHHGSRTSSSKEFIDEINPNYSIISVGKNNRYGHPNKEVLNTLNNTKIYRIDQDGSIMFKIKNDKLKIETCSP